MAVFQDTSGPSIGHRTPPPGITLQVQSSAAKEDIAIADQILTTNTDKIINAANAETFDANVYEEVVKCYRRVQVFCLKIRKTLSRIVIR